MFKVEDKGRVDYSKFDNIDSDVLEAYLRADLNAPEGQQMEPEAIAHIIELLSERQGDKQIDWEQKAEEAVTRFQEDCLPYVGEAREVDDFYNDLGDDEADNGKVILLQRLEKYWRRFASAAAILVLVVFGSGATAYALGFNPFPVRAVWDDEQFWFERVPVTQELAEKAAEYSGGIACVPKWLPEGYKAGSLVATKSDKYVYIAADFHTEAEDGQKEICIDYRVYADPRQMARHEKDSGEVTEYVCNGIPHYIMSNLDRAGIVWYNENIEGSIKGEFSVDEAKRIIKSIYGE